MEGFAYFPAIVYRDERPDLIENILPVCDHHLNQAQNNNFPIYQSQHLVSEPNLKNLKDYLLNSSVELLKSQGYFVDRYEFYFQGLWVQQLNKGAGTNVHSHKNSQMCGWFFLETPENGSYPLFHDTRLNKSMIELDFIQESEITNATNTIHFNSMIPGTVLFANSWMQHQLSVNNSNMPTKCVHFIISHKELSCNTY